MQRSQRRLERWRHGLAFDVYAPTIHLTEGDPSSDNLSLMVLRVP